MPRIRKLSAGGAPVFLEPFDVGLEPAGRGDEGGRAHRRSAPAPRATVADRNVPSAMSRSTDFGVVLDLDPQPFGGEIKRVQHRAAAAEEEGVGAAEAERAAERRLPAHALLDDPGQDLLRLADHETGELLVGMAARDPQKVVPELVLGVRAGEDLGGAVVGAAHVAGVAGVAAAIELGRGFQHDHGRARAPGADRGAQRGVAAADHQRHRSVLSDRRYLSPPCCTMFNYTRIGARSRLRTPRLISQRSRLYGGPRDRGQSCGRPEEKALNELHVVLQSLCKCKFRKN